MDKFQEFQQNYEAAVERIKAALNSEDTAVRHLVNWLFYTPHNPYGIFSERKLSDSMDSAVGFAGICGLIDHALLDDGDLCFPVVNGRPHLAFVYRYDVEPSYFANESDRIFLSSLAAMDAPEELSVTFLENVFQFTECFDKTEADREQRMIEEFGPDEDLVPPAPAPDRFAVFAQDHQDCLESIEEHMRHKNAEVAHLVNWLYQTEHNPYGIFSQEWACSGMSSAGGFAGICHAISHAITDDGDISFPVVDGAPHIAFVHRREGKPEHFCNEADMVGVRMRRHLGKSEEVPITFLKNGFEFTEAFEAAEAANKVRCEETERWMQALRKQPGDTRGND